MTTPTDLTTLTDAELRDEYDRITEDCLLKRQQLEALEREREVVRRAYHARLRKPVETTP